MREPSCVLNHKVIRKQLTDKGLPATRCFCCNWLITPVTLEKSYEPNLIDGVPVIIVKYLRALYIGAYYREMHDAMDAIIAGETLAPAPYGIDDLRKLAQSEAETL